MKKKQVQQLFNSLGISLAYSGNDRVFYLQGNYSNALNPKVLLDAIETAEGEGFRIERDEGFII